MHHLGTGKRAGRWGRGRICRHRRRNRGHASGACDRSWRGRRPGGTRRRDRGPGNGWRRRRVGVFRGRRRSLDSRRRSVQRVFGPRGQRLRRGSSARLTIGPRTDSRRFPRQRVPRRRESRQFRLIAKPRGGPVPVGPVPGGPVPGLRGYLFGRARNVRRGLLHYSIRRANRRRRGGRALGSRR